MSVIEVEDVCVNYDQIEALRNVSFNIEAGEFIGIIGPNGGGKSTMVKSILGLIKPNSGQVVISDDAVLGYVPQHTTFDRNFPISVEEVILTGHLPKKFKLGISFTKHEKKHALDVMKELGIEALRKRQIGALSGGQMQRVLVARALMNHPTILVLDEPTAGVDEKSKEAIYAMLKELNKSITILMITHDTEQVMAYFDRVVYINKTVHVHDEAKADRLVQKVQMGIEVEEETYEKCPINWFVEGEKLHKELLQEEVKYDRSNLKL